MNIGNSMQTARHSSLLPMGEELRPFHNSGGRFIGRQCEATSKQSGHRCRNFTGHPGLNVCRYHGGAVKRTRRAADERIKSLLPLAIRALQEILETERSPARLRAAVRVIKMAGINETNLWKNEETTQKAIGSGQIEETVDDQIEQLLGALRDPTDTQAPENARPKTDIPPTSLPLPSPGEGSMQSVDPA